MNEKILGLNIDNFMRIKCVRLTLDPDSGVLVIKGDNGEGKTSVLAAIEAAFGGKGSVPPQPLRAGADKGAVEVTLDDLVIRREFDGKGTHLKVTATNGRKYSNAQEILDALKSKVWFDPLAFARKKPKEQAEDLLAVTPLEIDLAALAAERQTLYDQRAEANRDVKRLEAQFAGKQFFVGAPEALISVADLSEQLEKATKENDKRAQARQKLSDAAGRLEMLRAELAELERNVPELEAAALPPVDVTDLREKLATADELNNQFRANQERRQVDAERGAAINKHAALEEAIAKLDEKKAQALASAPFPVAGLSFADEGVLYNGIPFEQCAASEQLRVSVAVAIAANPTLKEILVRDGSLLDGNSLRELNEMATAAGYRVWLERVGTDGDVGIIIEDGTNVGAETPPTQEPTSP